MLQFEGVAVGENSQKHIQKMLATLHLLIIKKIEELKDSCYWWAEILFKRDRAKDRWTNCFGISRR